MSEQQVFNVRFSSGNMGDGGLRDISDHCAIWWTVDKEDWGPKPFKFNNEFFSYRKFILFVETNGPV